MMAQKFIRNSGVDTLVSHEPRGFFEIHMRTHKGLLRALKEALADFFGDQMKLI